METRVCNKCKIEKDINKFGNTYKKEHFSYTENTKYKLTCKDCIAAYARDWRKKHPGYIGSNKLNKYPKKDRALMAAIRRRFNAVKQRAKKYSSIIPTVDADYLYQVFKKQKGLCAYTGTPLLIKTGQHTSLSIDKINPKKGYTIGNVQWLCWVANRAKGDMSEKLFLRMCKSITTKCNDYSERKYIQVNGSAQLPDK